MDRTWDRMQYRGEYNFLFISQLVEEVELIMYNLILFLHHKYRDEVLQYFTNKVLKAAKEDS